MSQVRLRSRVAALAMAVPLVATTMAAVASGAGAATRHPSANKVSVTMANAVPVDNAGEVWDFAPQGFGMFAREHLSVSDLWDDGGGLTFSQVIAGQAQFGESSPENLINAIQAGEPLHPISTLITKSIYSVGVLAKSNVTSYDQLAGKPIGVSALTSGSYPFAQEAMAANHLAGKVQYTVAGNGGPAAQALSSGSVAALVTTDTQWVTIEHLGVKVRFLTAPPSGNYPADVLFTSNAYYHSHRRIVDDFAAAVYAGIAKAEKDPVKAAFYFEEQNPSLAGAIPPAENLAIAKARLRNTNLIPAQHARWGFMPLALYAHVEALGLAYGVVKRPGINIRKVLSNVDVPTIDKIVATLLK